MRSGVVELRSGRWDWTLESAELGSKLVFRRWGVSEEEMVTWIPGKEIHEAAAAEAGRDPLHRSWADSIGLVWQVSLEALKPWKVAVESVPPGEEEAALALVFARGWHKRGVLVTRETRLGDLTRMEMARHFAGAEPWR